MFFTEHMEICMEEASIGEFNEARYGNGSGKLFPYHFFFCNKEKTEKEGRDLNKNVHHHTRIRILGFACHVKAILAHVGVTDSSL